MSDDFDAKEAADHCLRPVARFRELSPGERFRFPGTQKIFVRTRTGYRFGDGPTFKTGAATAVIPVQQEVQHG